MIGPATVRCCVAGGGPAGLDIFLALPHEKAHELRARFGAVAVTVADFRHLPVRYPFIAFMPQWYFLDFLARQAAAHSSFRLCMRAEATGLLEEQGWAPSGPRSRGWCHTPPRASARSAPGTTSSS